LKQRLAHFIVPALCSYIDEYRKEIETDGDHQIPDGIEKIHVLASLGMGMSRYSITASSISRFWDFSSFFENCFSLENTLGDKRIEKAFLFSVVELCFTTLSPLLYLQIDFVIERFKGMTTSMTI
jgi:hypothetical protein